MTSTISVNSVNPRVARARARAAVSASLKTGDILPRRVYQIAELEVPPNATDELQSDSGH